ncbi:hypothetical protein QUA69_27335 [Microcoleus sp. LAD1_D1]|uniref:hypothetical protein n=1 Tax=Microcoleus sp. LAD1_D1 TaxID=2818812 RepID=UPI002FD1EF5E
MAENQATLQAIEERSQKSIFSRRKFFHKTASALPLPIALRRQPSIKLPDKYPAPSFQIGDIIADEWLDEFDVKQRDIGEIVGICWHPTNDRWEYLINWTAGTIPELYPCFDERLISHEVGFELSLVQRNGE